MTHDEKPSAKNHFIRGVDVHITRWELNYECDPEVDQALRCECGAPLEYNKMSTSQRGGKYKVIFKGGGQRPAVGVQAHYACSSATPLANGEKCGRTYGATDPHILRRLPARYAKAYPVSPEHSTPRSGFHFAESFENNMEISMITYENANVLLKHERNNLALLHESHRCDYLEHIAAWRERHREDNIAFPDFPSLEE